MGIRTRHFCALMKKNWIIWKRTLVASICELACPVILMAILAVARVAITASDVSATSNISKTAVMMPLQNLYMNPLAYNTTMQNLNGQYANFSNFSGLNITSNLPDLKFIPTLCAKQKNYQVTPVIAYAGNSSIALSVVRDLQTQLGMGKYLLQNFNISKQVLQALGISSLSDLNVNFTFQPFASHQAIIDYISSDRYLQDSDHPGVCFGFSITENKDSDFDVKLIFNDHSQEVEKQGIPSQLKAVWSEFKTSNDFTSYNQYTKYGYSYLQNWFANYILRNKTGNVNATIINNLVPFKTDKYIDDKFSTLISSMLPFFMLLMYILPVYRLISNIVAEKESKARESMKMMGLKDFSYWLSWFTYYLIVVTIISIACTIILSFNVFKYTNKGLIFLFFWIYGISLFGLVLFIQSFFSRARVAAITGTLVYFGTSFINSAVSDENVSQGGKGLASLLTTVAVSLGSNILGNFETSGRGLTTDNINTQYQNYRFSACLILMAISFMIFLWLGIYFDNVLPSAYGLRKPWYFCLTASYWFGRDNHTAQVHQRQGTVDLEQSMENEAFFEAKYMKKENFEPPARELLKQEQEGKILKISDLKKTFDNGFQAVKGLNVKMYNGQIFALLGHNGAGKTTTISMLTGLINSTSGFVEAFGLNLFEEIQKVRQFLGVCPQHDILFDLLTPEEHLDIFCDFKGVPSKDKKAEIKKMLIDVDVYYYRDTMAKNLSGGSRRKLSVAIALVGGSKLVLLDEPTSGMDLSARRKLWNMLKKYKSDRIIILTTHYMDEADILGDRIGIMTGGQVICLGSSLFLKNRFGVGYNLTMVKKSKEPNMLIGPYLENKLGEVKKLSEVSSEITYQIPTALSYKFKEFFTGFDFALEELNIRSYGISVTTLEEVFLRVGHGDDTNENAKLKDDLKNTAKELAKDQKSDEFTIATSSEHGICNVFSIHITALFLKRFFIYKRNYKGLIVEILIPVLLVLIGFAFSKVQFFFNGPERLLEVSLFPLKQRILMNSNLVQMASLSSSNILPSQFAEYLPNRDKYDITYKNYSGLNMTKGQQTILETFDNDVFENRYTGGVEPYRYGSFFIYEANNLTKQFKVSTLVNITSQDVAGIYPQFMYEAILKAATGNSNLKFKVTTAPFPITENLRQRAQTANGIFIVFVVAIGFSLIPAAVVSFILNEREKNLKHMQLISGMSLPAYWISNLVFDIVKGIIPSAIVIGLMYAFSLEYDYVWILFLLYPISVIPFTYVTSFMFGSENIAQTVTIFLHFVFAGIGAIVAYILRIIDSTYVIGDILAGVFKIIPSYCLTDSIMYSSFKSILFQLRPELNVDAFNVKAIGGDILIMCCHFVFWLLVLVLIEAGAFNCFSKMLNWIPKNKIRPKTNMEFDEDVIEEQTRVANADKDSMKVRVNMFRKVYPSLFRKPVLAVERTSFGLDYGECFALLGVNGAGKSTTFKSLTCETAPTAGEITINGFDAQREFSKARKLIGYCPQYDAIFELMTVEEHLIYYARIKGIPPAMRNQLIEKQIKEMSLEEHRKKPAGTLSGGNKRKLSVAMAVLGNPPIILLDEPSAGMDPEARRFMWSVVARISQQRKQSAVILTTHSMEEAEALSTKMGIMVKGGIFKCFGSSQHIKNKYGTGFEVEVKVRKLQPSDLQIMAQQFGFNDEKEKVELEKLPELMKSKGVDEFLISELRADGLGGDLIKEAEEHDGLVQFKHFLNWLYVEQSGMVIINELCEEFQTVEVLEHYNDYFKMRVPRQDKSIGFVFGFIENKKEEFKISEYSVSQTTLEQIFQTFANIQIDDDKPKLKFHKGEQISNRASQYANPESKEVLKRQFSKTNQDSLQRENSQTKVKSRFSNK